MAASSPSEDITVEIGGDGGVIVAETETGPVSPELVVSDALAAERDKHMQRAKRFGTEYVAPIESVYVPPTTRRYKFADTIVSDIDLLSPEEIEKRKERALRFGGTESAEPELAPALMEIEPPKIPENVRLVPEVVHVFGTDILTTEDIFKYFLDYIPSEVEWLDDSSCNVFFANAEAARKALDGLSLVPSEDASWRDAKLYKGVPLKIRLAVSTDRKPAIPQRSKYLYKKPPHVLAKLAAPDSKKQNRQRSRGRDRHMSEANEDLCEDSAGDQQPKERPALDFALGTRGKIAKSERRGGARRENRKNAIVTPVETSTLPTVESAPSSVTPADVQT